MEISGGISSGKATLAFGACLGLLQTGKAVAWIDSGSGFWPVSALEAQLPLEKLLVLRIRDGMSALRAAHLLLSCHGAAAAVVVELPQRFVPANTNLVKLQRLAGQSGTALVFLTERAPESVSLGPAVALRLCVKRRLEKRPEGMRFALLVEIARHKGGVSRQSLEEPLHGPDRLRVHSSL